MRLKTIIRKNLVNIPGWRTNEKLVVFESDDWGSIRMPSLDAYQSLLREGVPVDKHKFTLLDALESKEDLEMLFETLLSFKDSKGNHPVITANTLTANPDFAKIRESNFKDYYYQTIDLTYREYGEIDLLDYWQKEGIAKKLLHPQFHGREHLHPGRWLRVLRSGSEHDILGFNKRALLGEMNDNKRGRTTKYMAAFEYHDEKEKKDVELITEEGLSLFKKIFGFQSKSFAASQSIWGDHLNKTLYENGVLFHQLGQQFVPHNGGIHKKDRFWGAESVEGMLYWRRNCTFEPYKNQNSDRHIEDCLKEMEIAFRWGKPAVINSHRINYVGRLNENHRHQSLKKLNSLLSAITKKWPDVEFMTSEKLGEVILDSKNR